LARYVLADLGSPVHDCIVATESDLRRVITSAKSGASRGFREFLDSLDNVRLCLEALVGELVRPSLNLAALGWKTTSITRQIRNLTTQAGQGDKEAGRCVLWADVRGQDQALDLFIESRYDEEQHETITLGVIHDDAHRYSLEQACMVMAEKKIQEIVELPQRAREKELERFGLPTSTRSIEGLQRRTLISLGKSYEASHGVSPSLLRVTTIPFCRGPDTALLLSYICCCCCSSIIIPAR
jgi:hypothetical protein